MKMKIFERNNCAACLRGRDAELFVDKLFFYRDSIRYEAWTKTVSVLRAVHDLVSVISAANIPTSMYGNYQGVKRDLTPAAYAGRTYQPVCMLVISESQPQLNGLASGC